MGYKEIIGNSVAVGIIFIGFPAMFYLILAAVR